MNTKQTPISVLNPEQLNHLGILMQQDFDLCNFAQAAKIDLAQALAFIGNSCILEAIEFIKEFELSRLAHNAARARSSTVLLLNRFIHRHDSYDPDHLAENAPVSPHARLITSAAATLARISDLKSSTKNAPRSAPPPLAPKAPPSPSTSPANDSAAPSSASDSSTPPSHPDGATNPSEQLAQQESYLSVADLHRLTDGVPSANTHVQNVMQQRSRRR